MYYRQLSACTVSYKPGLRCFRIYCSAISALLEWTKLVQSGQNTALTNQYWAPLPSSCQGVLARCQDSPPDIYDINDFIEARARGQEMVGTWNVEITTCWKLPNIVSDLLTGPRSPHSAFPFMVLVLTAEYYLRSRPWTVILKRCSKDSTTTTTKGIISPCTLSRTVGAGRDQPSKFQGP